MTRTILDPIVFQVVRPVPEFGLEPGDDVVFDPSAPRLFSRITAVPSAAAVRVYATGAMRPLTAAPTPADLAAAIGLATSAPASGPTDSIPMLRLVKPDGRGAD